jgi:hypothetical protein
MQSVMPFEAASRSVSASRPKVNWQNLSRLTCELSWALMWPGLAYGPTTRQETPARRPPLNSGPRERHSRLDRRLERQPETLHLDQDRRRDPPESCTISSTNSRRRTLMRPTSDRRGGGWVGRFAGGHAIYYASKGYSATGIDGSPTAIELAKRNAERAGLQVNFQVADATKLDGFESVQTDRTGTRTGTPGRCRTPLIRQINVRTICFSSTVRRSTVSVRACRNMLGEAAATNDSSDENGVPDG